MKTGIITTRAHLSCKKYKIDEHIISGGSTMKIKYPLLYSFVPLLSIVITIGLVIVYSFFELGAHIYFIADDALTIIIIAVSNHYIFSKCSKHKHPKLNTFFSSIIFVSSIRLLASSIQYMIYADKLTAAKVVCLALWVLSIAFFALSVNGAFLLKKDSISISIHILGLIHTILATILSALFYPAPIIFSSCIPISCSFLIHDYYIAKRRVIENDEN